ncbi:hypothetical protein FO519_001229 [Halicephalobus sp. NKZ332]|nr:hypothetical protein FO519_001229 [Halicephalobus sp. NKZ332]
MSSTPELSKAFFYFFFTEEVPPGYQPILQIIQTKKVITGNIRARLFDGVFRYSDCFLVGPCLDDHPGIENTTSIIRVLEYDMDNSENHRRAFLKITSCEILVLNAPVPNHFYSFDGKPETVADIVHQHGYQLSQGERSVHKRARQDSGTNSPFKFGSSQDEDSIHPPVRKREVKDSNRSLFGTPGITPIASLSPFVNKWKICGVCISREALRDIQSQKGPLRVMSFVLMDEHNHSIKITAWNEVADDLNAKITEGDCYYVTGEGCIRKKNKKFNRTDHDYEIGLNSSCETTVCTDRSITMPKFSIKRTKISDIPDVFVKDPGSIIDLLVVVDKIGEPQIVHSQKKNVDFTKREISLVDDSNASTVMVLWEEQTEHLPFEEGMAVALKDMIIKEFNGGFTVSRGQGYKMVVNPELPETISLYSCGLGMANVERDTRLLSITRISNMADNSGDAKGVYFYSFVTITDVKKDGTIVYPACTTCNKKVTDNQHGGFDCEKCGVRGKASYKLRYMLSVQISDFTDSTYVTLFDDLAQELLGMTAGQMEILKSEDFERYHEVFNSLLHKSFLARLRVTNEFYNDMKKTKFNVMSLKPVNYNTKSRILDMALQKLENL